MRSIILLIIFALLAATSYGQFLDADHKKAEELKHRPLIVALFDPAEEAKTYCDSIHMEYYNIQIRKLIREQWKLSDSIIFMRSRRVASIIASKSNDYVIFSAGPSLEGQQSSNDVFWFPSFTFMLYLSEDGKKFDSRMVDRALYSSPLVPDIEMTGHLSRGKYIFKLSFLNMYLSENDLAFALAQFNEKITEALQSERSRGGLYARKLPDKNLVQLETKTLLIPQGLDPDAEDAKKISGYYTYPFRIASDDDINDIIAKNTPDYAYIHYIWSDHQRMFQAFVIDTETHKVLAVFKPGGIEFDLDDCPETGISYRNHIVMKAKRLKAIH